MGIGRSQSAGRSTLSLKEMGTMTVPRSELQLEMPIEGAPLSLLGKSTMGKWPTSSLCTPVRLDHTSILERDIHRFRNFQRFRYEQRTDRYRLYGRRQIFPSYRFEFQWPTDELRLAEPKDQFRPLRLTRTLGRRIRAAHILAPMLPPEGQAQRLQHPPRIIAPTSITLP